MVNQDKQSLPNPKPPVNRHFASPCLEAPPQIPIPISLNNVGGRGLCDLFTSGPAYTEHHETPDYQASTPVEPIKTIHGPFALLSRKDRNWDQGQKRSLVQSLINNFLPHSTLTSSHWAKVNLWAREVIAAGIVFDRPGDEFRQYNFKTCYRGRTRGRIYTRKDNPEIIHRQRLRCNEPACLDCKDASRRARATDWLGTWKAIVKTFPNGFKGILRIVVTLPESIEHIPLKEKKIEDKLKDWACLMVKRLFGLNTHHNLATILSVHPVGDDDILRDRWHLHIDILPAVIDPKTGEFRWLEPVHTAPGHSEDRWKIDLIWLRREWVVGVRRIFPDLDRDPINPEVRFIAFNIPRSQERLKRSDSDWMDLRWAKVAHGLRYSLRGFGRNVENAILYPGLLESGQPFLVLKAEYSELIHWYLVPVPYMIERFLWIREKATTRARGFLRRLNHYEDVLQIKAQEEPEPDPNDYHATSATVHLVREKRYDEKRRKVVWLRDDIYEWTCPVTGKQLSVNAEDLPPWRWKLVPLDRGG